MGVSSDKFSEIIEKGADKELRAGTWAVYGKYRRRRPRNGEKYIEAPAYVDLHEKNERWEYEPLKEERYLFLEFARLADDHGLDTDSPNTEKNEAVALEWAETHGVLGLTPAKGREAWWGEPQGGKDDTVAGFAYEALVANSTLRLYEAVTVDGEPDVEAIAPFIASRHRGFLTSTPGVARDWALEQVVRNVQDRVARYAYPQLYERPDGSFVQGWDFANLLGAMWLQMFWLLTADHKRRCDNWECNRIIAYEQPEQIASGLKRNDRSAGYSTRADKAFCSKKCANRHYYLTVTKFKRQAASSTARN